MQVVIFLSINLFDIIQIHISEEIFKKIPSKIKRNNDILDFCESLDGLQEHLGSNIIRLNFMQCRKQLKHDNFADTNYLTILSYQQSGYRKG